MRPRSTNSQVAIASTTLAIDAHSVDRVERLAQRLVERRMRVDGVQQRLDRSLSFHRQDAFADQLESLRPNDVDPQDLAILLVGDDLHEAVVLAQDRRLT